MGDTSGYKMKSFDEWNGGRCLLPKELIPKQLRHCLRTADQRPNNTRGGGGGHQQEENSYPDRKRPVLTANGTATIRAAWLG